MMNNFMVIGRLVNDVELKEENGKKYADITLAIPRNYKNEEGIYETDFIHFTIYDSTALNTSEYCRKGDIIGVRGRLETKDNQLCLLVEKLSFISSKKNNEEE